MKRAPLSACFGCFALVLTACTATPPANWAKGGAVLELPRARWVRGDVIVDLVPEGQILVNGEPYFTLDRAGRIADLDGEPVALLEADGRVTGADDTPMGMVGWMNAALADQSTAWLSIQPSGQVVRYDDEGEAVVYGVWMGCGASPRTHQACTYVTHVLAQKLRTEEPRSGVSIGIGVGVGVPLR
jgi:hypothetical protein